MNDLKIDEEYMQVIYERVFALAESIKKDAECLIKKDGDIFERYITFCNLRSLEEMIGFGNKIFRKSFAEGFQVNNKIFKTPRFIQCGWNEDAIRHNVFFCQEESQEFKEEEEKVRRALLRALEEETQEEGGLFN